MTDHRTAPRGALTSPQKIRLHTMKAYAVFVCTADRELALRLQAVIHFGRATTLAKLEGVPLQLIAHETDRVDAAIERMASR